MSEPKKNWIKLFYSLVITLGTGTISALATASSISGWYTQLSKPWFNPPDWLFGPIWTFIYILMGIALYLVWRQALSRHRYNAISFFFIQLFLNFCWSFIFFYFHQIGFALLDISLLWIFILFTIISFAKHHKIAALLLIPYLAWVTFATILNIALYRLN